MQQYDINDTIAAIATPIGEGGIGIVRISGQNALSIADKIFQAKDKGKPSSYKTYTTHYGWIMNGHKPQASGHRQKNKSLQLEAIDEVILTVMRAPRSYTKEDVVEINCHGGIVALRRVLDLVVQCGARLAEPGEFTKRAFLSGRIDLTQAEAVLDIIQAKTDAALKVGAEQLRGALSRRIRKLRDTIFEVVSLMEANIDFSEEGVDSFDAGKTSITLRKVCGELKSILLSAKQGRVLREGIRAVICGKPNVGKSSLLNALLKQERSIVTPVAGTTRDTIEEIIDIKGIPVRIVDTAGIISPRDLIEKKAVERSRRSIKDADIVLLVFDASQRLNRQDHLLIRKLKGKKAIAIINKIDLKKKVEEDVLRRCFSVVVELCAKRMKHIGSLEDAISQTVFQGHTVHTESVIVSNVRHVEALRRAEKLIEEALNSLDNKLSLEFIAQDLKGGLESLNDLLGEKCSADILDKIFSEFCIGK